MDSIVVLKHCDAYEIEKVKEKIYECFNDLGGLKKYISPGDKVLLKVNLLMKKRPEEATTTHPVFVEALAEILIAYGAKVLIGDSPGGPFLRKFINPIYKVSGMTALCERTGAELNTNFNQCEKQNPKGLLLKKIIVTDMLNDVDKVISLSKLKTHGMMTFTGAVKNMFGIIPGVMKAEYHFKMPDYENFANALIDICLLANPVLSFMDGIIAMEGDGPSAGSPRQLNVILASENPFLLDKAALKIIQLPLKEVPVMAESIKRGLCTGDDTDIQLAGDPIDHFTVNDFKGPSHQEVNFLSKHPLLNKLTNNFNKPRPVIHKTLCVQCGICKENCPAKVIQSDDSGYPEIKLKNCIRCFCCQELCPRKAISIHNPLILKIITKL